MRPFRGQRSVYGEPHEPAFTYAVRLVALVICSIVYGAFFVLLMWAIASVMLRSVS